MPYFNLTFRAFLLGFSFSFLGACSTEPELILIEGRTMGTTYSVKVAEPVNQAELAQRITERLAEVNNLMSTYIADSEISMINRLAVGESLSLSEENLAMLTLSERLQNDSQGKFDVTLGPLIALWGFGADPRRTDVPAQVDIDRALASMGHDGFRIDAGRLTKLKPVKVDFSAIAKGFGVDELASLVEQAGASNYLIEIGGELRASGLNQRGQIWRIGIETPDTSQRVPFTAVPLKNLAMATSGDYRNYFEVDGRRFSHTLDPETGFPITHNVASVTVLAPSAAAADGYATAINVMGDEAGFKLANELNLPILVILKDKEAFEMKTNQAFDAYLQQAVN